MECLKPVMVRHEVFSTKKDCEIQLEKIIDLYDKKLKFKKGEYKDDLDVLEVLNSPQYPQDDEFEAFTDFVKMIMKHFTFIHPQNKNKQHLEGFTTCEQLFR
jgi:hypothetical protein